MKDIIGFKNYSQDKKNYTCDFYSDDKSIILKDINMKYKDLIVFEDLNIEFKKNLINVILGPSGCGKTSLINIVADHFEKKSYVFQEARLLSWKTVYDNIDYVLKSNYKSNNKKDKSLRDKLIKDSLNTVGLIDKIKAKPDELSGGMKQRLSLARSLAYNADIILMDEPLQGQDIKKKKYLLDIIINTQEKNKKTIIYVTHDVQEAVIIGDKIFVMGEDIKNKIILESEINIKKTERSFTDENFIKIQSNVTAALLV